MVNFRSIFVTKQGFLSHIAGLRGLAVSLVVLAHLDVPGFTNGFFGVDVFFVISGFLITGLLVAEYESNRSSQNAFGWISLKLFYFRRAKRILPASIFVSLIVLGVAFLIDNKFAFEKVLNDFWYAVFFGANINFLQQSTDYFQNFAAASPYQHFWSLSIEEQFYFVWPLLLISALAFHALKIFGRPVSWRLRIFWPVVAIVVASIAFMILEFLTNPSNAYFSLTSRAWELGFGALVAIAKPWLNLKKWQSQALASVGLVAIVSSLTIVNSDNFGFSLFVPVVGAALFLAHGDSLPMPANPLKWTPFVAVGNISYSLYLWHWPLIVYATQMKLLGDAVSQILIVLVAIILSAMTFLFIEQPFINLKVPRFIQEGNSIRGTIERPIPKLLNLFGAAVISVGLIFSPSVVTGIESIVASQLAAPADIPDIAISTPTASASATKQADSATALADWATKLKDSVRLNEEDKVTDTQLLSLQRAFAGEVSSRDTVSWVCNKVFNNGNWSRTCKLGAANAKIKVLIIGDSHADMWGASLRYAVEQHPDLAVTTWIAPACPNALSAQALVRKEPLQEPRANTWCQEMHDYEVAQLKSGDLNFDLILFSDYLNYKNSSFPAANIEFLKLAKTVSDKVVTIGPSPDYPDPKECLNRDFSNPSQCFGTPDTARENISVADNAAASTDYLSISEYFCQLGKCPLFLGDNIATADGNHLFSNLTYEFGPVFDALVFKGLVN